MDGEWVDPGTVPAVELAVADRNWAIAQLVVDSLVRDLKQHRATGCTEWTCPGTAGRVLVEMDDAQVHMLARAALEMLARPLATLWTGVKNPDCICEWEPDPAGGFAMTWIDPTCPLHGRGQPADFWTLSGGRVGQRTSSH